MVARLSAENELDALQNAGLSLGRISRPFLLIGLLAAGIGFGLYGYLQPYARYAYRAAFHAATNNNWDAAIVPGEIIHVSRDLVITTDQADRFGGHLHRVVIYQRRHGQVGRKRSPPHETATLSCRRMARSCS